jgi:hypothetical protein
MNSVISSTMNQDMINLQKMVFIYNSVMAGWTVRKIDKNNFEFIKKSNSDIKKEINLETYLKKFINYNLTIDNIYKYGI